MIDIAKNIFKTIWKILCHIHKNISHIHKYIAIIGILVTVWFAYEARSLKIKYGENKEMVALFTKEFRESKKPFLQADINWINCKEGEPCNQLNIEFTNSGGNLYNLKNVALPGFKEYTDIRRHFPSGSTFNQNITIKRINIDQLVGLYKFTYNDGIKREFEQILEFSKNANLTLKAEFLTPKLTGDINKTSPILQANKTD